MHPLPTYARLPLRFDVGTLRTALQALPDSAWNRHFNTDYYSGDWSGIPLLLPAEAHTPLQAAQSTDNQAVQASPWYDPVWQALLEQIPMRISSARLLRVGAGGRIHEHCDPDLGDPRGDVRLHIPILIPPDVEFIVDDLSIPLAVGECWFLDLARPHRVENPSSEARVHLVIDARRNDWLYAQIAAGLASTPAAGPSRSTIAFAAFRQQVHQRPELLATLSRIKDPRTFAEQAVQLGAVCDLHFSVDVVQAAMRKGRRAWIEQWIV
ncbi:aspartyl/asparaginyl beta-hydroxylase domain-containing protein [Ectopseudomonas mendocina]|uniref:Aspartyl/asparaginyl beta-hydroxylase domain-containing protein n=2 Tax=Ectopseudomonas mendocina TaxID=300 RepID=A0ABD7RZY3_ECTME|nr:aspartyl/asparaginyl beta-hydroxylase domain-containing protein [Pseudomonas mendocina]TRO18437.1 aspartyl/asparaginyl beta-hydroxylase domain-containing protein [Pseudomonas mendocina]